VPDYGHELRFGVSLTPTAADPDAVVELALVAERAGLDLVTVQDHPYQPRFLDTWTLLTWIAARTESLILSPNVANLPLRGPVILARSAASLDRLSGGRVELGLGAGAFWDAVAANGGPRRSPRESVDALVEAIAVIARKWTKPSSGFLLTSCLDSKPVRIRSTVPRSGSRTQPARRQKCAQTHPCRQWSA